MSISHNILSVILLISLTSAVPLQKVVETPKSIDLKDVNYRLPTNVKPSYYTIKLTPNIVENDFTFTGESSIKINVIKETKDITLHAKDLKINETLTTLINAQNASNVIQLKPISHLMINETDFLTITFKDALKVGEYTLKLNYAGVLHTDLNGFYVSYYKDARGEKVWLATTQFEPTWARRAFPCFDEPALKAKFEISINHYDYYTAVSNMPLKSQLPDDKNPSKRWSNFDVTPVMSTYLIAFVISDFKYLASKDGKFRVWSEPNSKHKGKYALEVGEKELEVLNKYTGIEHSSNIDKMDNFAIPHFRAGAMENWGIVTYRESALLFEENVTTTDSKQSIATIISHEFAHQWFGNLVSPLWWDYTWLNEGFANYFQYYITDKVETTWRLMEQFVIKNLQEVAFAADDKEDQHPMNGKVNSPVEISKFFDSITYSKAGCVIRMISHAMTDEVFQAGIKAYLSKKSGKEATSDDLFNELVAASEKVPAVKLTKEYLDSWANQRGYPVVTVLRNHTDGSAIISQHRFLTKKISETKESWFIPINYAMQSDLKFDDTKPSQWLKKELNGNTTITGLKKGWVIFNKQQTGYYRVNYDGDNWKLIIDYLNTANYTGIHVLNRAQLLDDSFHLAQAGELADHSVFLDITKYLKQEIDYIPWNAAFRAFGTLNTALSNTARHNIFKTYILRIIEKLEKNVTYTESSKDDHVTKFNRINTMNWACYVGSKDCATAARDKLEKHILGTSKVSTDLRSVVFCSGIRASNATIWEKMFSLYEKSNDANERNIIFTALGCSTDSKLLNSLLTKSITNGTQINMNEAIKTVLVGSPAGVNIAFDFINGKLKEILAVTGGNFVPIVKYLNDIGSRMTTKAQLEKLNKFIAANKEHESDLKSAVDTATSNIQWVAKNEKTIGSFLEKELGPTPKPSGSNTSSALIPTLQIILVALAASFVSRFH